jgi:hypothetical protein
MKAFKISFFYIILSVISCHNASIALIKNHAVKNPDGSTIIERFNTPFGFSRDTLDSNSYGFYLRHLTLFPDSHEVHYFNGELKKNKVFAAVLNIDVGNRDLQQCADAVMRLRAEYLFQQKRYSEIRFRFLGDGKMHSFLNYSRGKSDYTTFRKYMDYVFAFANTASLKLQLKKRPIKDAQIGDVFIQSGNPFGHAITIVDMAKDSLGNKSMLLAQSYMPAQEIHILKNFQTAHYSPWYPVSEGILKTPEWTFNSSDLRHF